MFQPRAIGQTHQATTSEPLISELEWRVAVLARQDADRFGWSAAAPRFPRLRRLLAVVTGMEALHRLADDRLEKLRLFLCMKRRGDRRADVVARDLMAMGFVPVALRKLEAVAVR